MVQPHPEDPMRAHSTLSLLAAAAICLALPPAAQAAPKAKAASVSSAGSTGKSKLHDKKARHHRKKAKHHRSKARHHRKRAKHLRTRSRVLTWRANEHVLHGRVKPAGKLLDKVAKLEVKAAAQDAKAAEHDTIADKHTDLGAPTASFGVAADLVQGVHNTGKPASGSALLVRRGSFVRLGLQVGDGCASAGFLLRDTATDTTLSLPLLARADGLALSAATRDGLALQYPERAEQLRAHFKTALGGDVVSTPASNKHGKRVAEFHAELTAAGSPFYAVTVERVSDGDGGNRAAVALWLPERTPYGAYELRFACDGVARTEALNVVVLYHPHAAATSEFQPDKAALAADLADTEAVHIGPLTVPFATTANWSARDAALMLTSAFPLSARAHAGIVARLGRRGPIQLTACAGYKSAANTTGRGSSADVWQDANAWNDATGHYDLWSGDKSSFRARPGRWSENQRAIVIFGTRKEDYAMGADKGGANKGLVGSWRFDDAHALDSSGHQHHGASAKFNLPVHNPVRIKATAHFIDDWQGETAFLKQGTSAYDAAFVAGETNAKTTTKLPQAYPQGTGKEAKQQAAAAGKADTADTKKPWEWSGTGEIFATWAKGGDTRVRYGQCWVFASVGTAMLRSIGVPTRTVTNFDAAHESKPLPKGIGPHNRGLVSARFDGKGEAKWDFKGWYEGFLKAGGDAKRAANYQAWNSKVWESDLAGKGPGESVWNFHVWVQARTGSQWWAMDATPQERSADWEKTATAGGQTAESGNDVGDGPALRIKRNPGVWFYPGSTRLHIRSGTK